jgi:thiamine biosynthesis lipoprotein
MNTLISFQIHGKKEEQVLSRVKAELFWLEKKLSRFVQDSEVSRINQFAGKDSVAISPETYEILSISIRLAEISHGLFDITVSPLVDLWNYKHSFHVPEEGKIRRTLALVNYRDLLMNSKEKRAYLRKKGQSIDLGGIGKGYASDHCIKVLQENGISSAFINIGGNVSTLGNKPEGFPWSVGIRHPRQENSLIGAVKVTGKAVVTSGDYERYFIDMDGERRHHILNTVTGYPIDSGLISVSVIYESAVIGDALSTAIFAAGIEKGLEYLVHFPGAEAIMVDKFLQVYITQGIKECFQAAEGVEALII